MGAGIGRTLFLLSYLILLVATVTGFLKFVLRENEIIKTLHKITGPSINALFVVFFFLSSLTIDRPIIKGVITALFILLVYTGLVTGRSSEKTWLLQIHRFLGIFSFALGTMLLFLFLMT